MQNCRGRQVLLLSAVAALAAAYGCGDELYYWEPDLTPHECSKTKKTCDPVEELCFEGTCVLTCQRDDDCAEDEFCDMVSENMETKKICWTK